MWSHEDRLAFVLFRLGLKVSLASFRNEEASEAGYLDEALIRPRPAIEFHSDALELVSVYPFFEEYRVQCQLYYLRQNGMEDSQLPPPESESDKEGSRLMCEVRLAHAKELAEQILAEEKPKVLGGDSGRSGLDLTIFKRQMLFDLIDMVNDSSVRMKAITAWISNVKRSRPASGLRRDYKLSPHDMKELMGCSMNYLGDFWGGMGVVYGFDPATIQLPEGVDVFDGEFMAVSRAEVAKDGNKEVKEGIERRARGILFLLFMQMNFTAEECSMVNLGARFALIARSDVNLMVMARELEEEHDLDRKKLYRVISEVDHLSEMIFGAESQE